MLSNRLRKSIYFKTNVSTKLIKLRDIFINNILKLIIIKTNL